MKPRIQVRPKPSILDSQDHESEQELSKASQNSSILKHSEDGRLNLNDVKVWADEIWKIARSPGFRTLKRGPTQLEIENGIMAKYQNTSETGRLKAMRKKLQEIVAKGQRYVICFSSGFFMGLVTYVCHFCTSSDSQICKKVLGYKISALGGPKVFGRGVFWLPREATVVDLNASRVHGMVISEWVGGIGHNLTRASVILFIGSLYSQAYKDQAIGIPAWEKCAYRRTCARGTDGNTQRDNQRQSTICRWSSFYWTQTVPCGERCGIEIENNSTRIQIV